MLSICGSRAAAGDEFWATAPTGTDKRATNAKRRVNRSGRRNMTRFISSDLQPIPFGPIEDFSTFQLTMLESHDISFGVSFIDNFSLLGWSLGPIAAQAVQVFTDG
jgi:hypothetical protein